MLYDTPVFPQTPLLRNYATASTCTRTHVVNTVPRAYTDANDARNSHAYCTARRLPVYVLYCYYYNQRHLCPPPCGNLAAGQFTFSVLGRAYRFPRGLSDVCVYARRYLLPSGHIIRSTTPGRRCHAISVLHEFVISAARLCVVIPSPRLIRSRVFRIRFSLPLLPVYHQHYTLVACNYRQGYYRVWNRRYIRF